MKKRLKWSYHSFEKSFLDIKLVRTVIIAKNNKINAPLAGSFANECTEVKMPDLTRNVPSKLRENAMIDNKIVQFLNMDFCSHVIKECIKAVVMSQGIKKHFQQGPKTTNLPNLTHNKPTSFLKLYKSQKAP